MPELVPPNWKVEAGAEVLAPPPPKLNPEPGPPWFEDWSPEAKGLLTPNWKLMPLPPPVAGVLLVPPKRLPPGLELAAGWLGVAPKVGAALLDCPKEKVGALLLLLLLLLAPKAGFAGDLSSCFMGLPSNMPLVPPSLFAGGDFGAPKRLVAG